MTKIFKILMIALILSTSLTARVVDEQSKEYKLIEFLYDEIIKLQNRVSNLELEKEAQNSVSAVVLNNSIEVANEVIEATQSGVEKDVIPTKETAKETTEQDELKGETVVANKEDTNKKAPVKELDFEVSDFIKKFNEKYGK